MKIINLSDEDYNTLMDLSKELQTQPNHYQAFPYYWEPSSKKPVPNINGEGEIVKVFCHDDCETMSPECYAESNPDLWNDFLDEDDCPPGREWDDDFESDWIQYLKSCVNCDIYTEDLEDKQEHNPSLFLSDVKGFIKHNKHHLGDSPHTYARTIWRMPKMEKLVKAIYRLNKNHSEPINFEAKVNMERKDKG